MGTTNAHTKVRRMELSRGEGLRYLVARVVMGNKSTENESEQPGQDL